MINILWLSLHSDKLSRGYWDQAILEDFFDGSFFNISKGYEFIHTQDPKEIEDGAIIVIPARHHVHDFKVINDIISKLSWCLIILTGDEEGLFPLDKLKHSNMLIYSMDPHPQRHKNISRHLPNGYSPKIKQAKIDIDRDLDWFFSGQVTHKRRKECYDALDSIKHLRPNRLIYTPGFTQGLDKQEYFKTMRRSKIALCPSGAVIPDSFRLWEALELGCLPLVDKESSVYQYPSYWEYLLGPNPLPLIEDWKDISGHIDYHLDTYPAKKNEVQAWYLQYKRALCYNIVSDIEYLSKQKPNMLSDITVLIPTSPISSHPDTFIIDETLESIRERLPNAEIIIMFDGVREEQKDRELEYEMYKERMLWKCSVLGMTPLIMQEHTHQLGMTREALKLVKTDTILFVEHDTPLVGDIPFEKLIQTIKDGHANTIRLNHESRILEEHRHLTLGTSEDIGGVPMTRTAQWSQRPHISSTEFYKNILSKFGSSNAKCMIEDLIHGKVAEAYQLRSRAGWFEWKTWIYTPEGNIQRSTNLDGRKDDPKYDDRFIY